MKEIVRLGLYLLTVCALAGAALSGTYSFTSGKIQAQKEKAERQALTAVLPGAVSFKSDNGYIRVFDGHQAPLGCILKVSAAGYSGRIEALVGVDTVFKVTRVQILSQYETPGLGAKITSPSFLAQFDHQASDRIRLRKDGGEIDAVTAATISSRAITNAVREKVDAFQKTVR
jgi:electron transport complex protein RnfG